MSCEELACWECFLCQPSLVHHTRHSACKLEIPLEKFMVIPVSLTYNEVIKICSIVLVARTPAFGHRCTHKYILAMGPTCTCTAQQHMSQCSQTYDVRANCQLLMMRLLTFPDQAICPTIVSPLCFLWQVV